MLAVLCVCVSWTDVRSRRIPNPFLLAGLLLAGVMGLLEWPSSAWLAHIGTGAAIVVALGLTAWFWPGRLGMGDVKLLGLLGFGLGLRPFVWIMTAACLGMLIVALPLLVCKRLGRHSTLPFAPFAAFGLLVYLLGACMAEQSQS